jgi:hypothetical protein
MGRLVTIKMLSLVAADNGAAGVDMMLPAYWEKAKT